MFHVVDWVVDCLRVSIVPWATLSIIGPWSTAVNQPVCGEFKIYRYNSVYIQPVNREVQHISMIPFSFIFIYLADNGTIHEVNISNLLVIWYQTQYNAYLVGGLEHQIYFPINIGNLIIPIDELIFFRGVAQPPTRYYHIIVRIALPWM